MRSPVISVSGGREGFDGFRIGLVSCLKRAVFLPFRLVLNFKRKTYKMVEEDFP